MTGGRALTAFALERMTRFPENPDKIFMKIVEELGEAAECRLKPAKRSGLGQEYADVVICIAILCQYDGVDLAREIEKKLGILAQRNVKVVDGIQVKAEDQ